MTEEQKLNLEIEGKKIELKKQELHIGKINAKVNFLDALTRTLQTIGDSELREQIKTKYLEVLHSFKLVIDA